MNEVNWPNSWRALKSSIKSTRKVAIINCRPPATAHVYTWRGAIRHAWLFAWPIESFRRTRAHSAGMKLARELGLPINPKFGRLEESLRNRNTTADQGGL